MPKKHPPKSDTLNLNTAGHEPQRKLDPVMAALRRKTQPVISVGTPDLTILEAFAGAGLLGSGLVAGAVAAGYRPRHLAYCEHDDVPAGIYGSNFGQDIPRVRDVRSIANGALGSPPTAAEAAFAGLALARSGRRSDPVDVLCGGPPCQDFSVVRAHRPAAGNGRCALYLSMVRLAEVLRPRMLIIENVAAAVRHKSGIVQQAVAHLESIGYIVSVKVIDAQDFGVAQHRSRFILVAVRADLATVPFNFPAFGASHGTRRYGVQEAIGDLRDIPGSAEFEGGSKDGIMQQRIRWLAEHPGQVLPVSMRAPCHATKIYGQAYQRMAADQPAPTLTRYAFQMANGRFTHPVEHRTLSPRECLRVQGVADWFRLPPGIRRSEMYRVVANGAPAPLGERLVLAAIQQDVLLPGGIRAKAVSAA